MLDKLVHRILGQSDRVFEIQQALTAVPALGPENGGQGELAKCSLVEEYLQHAGFTDIQRFDSPDPRVESGIRPNMVARRPGLTERTLWIFAHLDVVPPGAGWQSNPWEALRKGDLIFGRGVEDNQQAIASMIILAESLHALGIMPNLGLGLVFMADEENGSKHGLGWILKQNPDLFAPEDFLIVPDGGSENASRIEIAEKAQMWIKFEIAGKQTHASTPQNGKNALIAASALILALADLGTAFPERNPLFDPPCSTFVPTRHVGTDTAINILPGRDEFYLDCRIIPGIALEEVTTQIEKQVSAVAQKTGVQITTTLVQQNPSSITPASSFVVAALAEAIRSVYHMEPSVFGIGGGTVASLLRQKELHAAVWACLKNTCHQPNECSSLLATCKDACVFAHMLEGQNAGV